MNKTLLTITASVAVFLPALAGASEGLPDHRNPPQDLNVEHAEILVSGRDGDAADGYLTVWNGTTVQAVLVEVRSNAFGRVSMLRTEFSEGEPISKQVEGGLSVPGHAELRMRPGGIRLQLQEPLTRSEPLSGDRLTLVFDGGLELEVVADVVFTQDRLVRHRHGEADVEPN